MAVIASEVNCVVAFNVDLFYIAVVLQKVSGQLHYCWIDISDGKNVNVFVEFIHVEIA